MLHYSAEEEREEKKRLKREVSTFNKRAQQDEVKADYRAADMLTI